MAVMYSFCRHFSVRLGAILVAIASMVQSLLLGASLILSLNYIEWTRRVITNLVDSYQLTFVTKILMSVEENTKLYLQSAIVFLILHIYTCVLLIYGALKVMCYLMCNIPLAWPFLVVEFVRLALLFFLHISVMKFIKENFLDLGLLIILCLSGGFALLGLYYMWFCVLSLCQCIKELREDPIRSNKSGNKNLLESDFKHLTRNMEGRFSVAPVSISPYELQAVPRLRHTDYQFGYVGWPAHR